MSYLALGATVLALLLGALAWYNGSRARKAEDRARAVEAAVDALS
jgi:hypothetical protein